jgi:Flp pilus assembly protein TadB
MIQIKGQYTLDDFRKAQHLHARQIAGAANSRLILILITLLFFVSMVVLVLLGRLEWVYLLAPLVLLVLFLLFQYVYRPFMLARLFRKNSDLSDPFEMEFTNAGLAVRNSQGQAQVDWGEYVKWVEDRDLILLYRTHVMFQMLPKRLFASLDDVQFLRDCLNQSKVPEGGKGSAGLSRNRAILYAVVVVAIIVMLILNITGAPR